ncbi:hypothetical protein [Archangium sp.]|uniref:hypothetical protein n=1 Tax=Archangium sp. TaxID=1872627 RepID=UPI00389AC76B
MNRSRVALAVSAVLLSLWALPAEAQPANARQTSASKKLPAARKPAPFKLPALTQKPPGARKGTKAGLRGKQRPGTAPEPGTGTGEQPLAEPMRPAADAPVAAQPPASAQQQTLSAQPTNTPAGPQAERPWAKGVSKQDQDTALELFRAANVLVKESIFVVAVEKYRKALELWDHPAIHYNLALALMNLDQPIEVHEHLVAALRYGPEPLENEKFEYARNYKTLVEKQLARVDITCNTPGATVTMDGQTLFVAPGRYAGLVRPGAHSIVATLQGYLPTDQSRTVLPGETTQLDMKMFTSEDLVRYKRRWPAAIPWLVMGAGLAVAGGGSWLHLQARDDFSAFEAGITECGGCVPAAELASRRSQGNLMQNAAIGGYAVGGAAVITGAVLAFINQPQAYRIDPGQASQDSVSITPLLGGDSNGVLATFRF